MDYSFYFWLIVEGSFSMWSKVAHIILRQRLMLIITVAVCTIFFAGNISIRIFAKRIENEPIVGHSKKFVIVTINMRYVNFT